MKAREALILAENKKLINYKVKPMKDNEAKFMYEENKVAKRLEAKRLEAKYSSCDKPLYQAWKVSMLKQVRLQERTVWIPQPPTQLDIEYNFSLEYRVIEEANQKKPET